MSIRSLPSILIEEITLLCLSYVFTIVANYISGRHNEDWYSVQISCATLNNISIFILKCMCLCMYVWCACPMCTDVVEIPKV